MKLNALQIELSLFLLFAAAPCALPQGTFVNLDFQSANIIPEPSVLGLGPPRGRHAVLAF